MFCGNSKPYSENVLLRSRHTCPGCLKAMYMLRPTCDSWGRVSGATVVAAPTLDPIHGTERICRLNSHTLGLSNKNLTWHTSAPHCQHFTLNVKAMWQQKMVATLGGAPTWLVRDVRR